MAHLDIAMKEFSKFNLLPLVQWLRPEVRLVSVVEMPQELPATLRHVDVLAKAVSVHDDTGLEILECQTVWDPLLWRCIVLRAALVHFHYDLPVTTTLLALTPEAVIEEQYTYGRYRGKPLVHGVEVRRLYEESAERALASEVAALLPLVPVMKPADGDRARVLGEVVARIAELSCSPERKRLLIGWAATFATLNLSRAQIGVIVREASRRRNFMLNALQDLPLLRDTYQEGVDKGIDKGIGQSLAMIYEDRLGPMPPGLRQALLQVTDAATLRALFPLFLRGTADEIASKLLPCS